MSDQPPVRIPVNYGGSGPQPPRKARPENADPGPRAFVRSPATRVLPRDLDRAYPLIGRGEGSWLYDTAGNAYLDASSGGAMTSNLGHSIPDEVLETVTRQLRRLAYAHDAQFTTPMREALATELVRLAPRGFTRARFSVTGSDANEMALRLARQYWTERGEPGRHLIVSPAQAYHGCTMATLALTGRAGLQEPFSPYMVRQPHIPPATSWADPDGSRALAALDEILAAHEGQVAAFFAEPVSAASLPGYSPPAAFWEGLEERRREHGFLVVLDEVVTGTYRTGPAFAAADLPVQASIITLGKGLSCGFYPVSAVLARDEIVTAIAGGSREFEAGHTHDGNPVGCAAALAVLAVLEREKIPQRVAERGPVLRGALAGALAGCPSVREVRGRGYLIGVSYQDPRDGRAFPDPAWDMAARIDAGALDRGLIVYSTDPSGDGYAGAQTVFAPPLSASDADLAEMIARLADTVRAVTAETLAGLA